MVLLVSSAQYSQRDGAQGLEPAFDSRENTRQYKAFPLGMKR